MKKLLIVYDSEYNATQDVARILKDLFIENNAFAVELSPVELSNIAGYQYVIIGSPIHFGKCTSKINHFLKCNKHILAQKSVALFLTCMSVKPTPNDRDIPVYIDPGFDTPEKPLDELSFVEKVHASANYINHVVKYCKRVPFINIAIFKGNLEIKKMRLVHQFMMFFAMRLLPDIKEGYFINSNSIHYWAKYLNAYYNMLI